VENFQKFFPEKLHHYNLDKLAPER